MKLMVRLSSTTMRFVRSTPGRRLGFMLFSPVPVYSGKRVREARYDRDPMTAVLSATAAAECLINAGLPQDEVGLWLEQKPPAPSEFSQDCKTFSDYWLMSKRLLGRLPQKPRTEREEMAARVLQD